MWLWPRIKPRRHSLGGELSAPQSALAPRRSSGAPISDATPSRYLARVLNAGRRSFARFVVCGPRSVDRIEADGHWLAGGCNRRCGAPLAYCHHGAGKPEEQPPQCDRVEDDRGDSINCDSHGGKPKCHPHPLFGQTRSVSVEAYRRGANGAEDRNEESNAHDSHLHGVLQVEIVPSDVIETRSKRSLIRGAEPRSPWVLK